MKPLKLYVWEDVLEDWSAGVMFALAQDADHARELIRLRAGNGIGPHSHLHVDLAREPRVIEQPEGFVVWGGS